ncbi:hypothetical protein XI07_09715 [Bradyrhizobium sp. CCBAU 11445]|nr:hypothetical protein [Bradyrhizobium sp. CCBAU 11445]MDA9522786.1 hypothetical protein [Bradyrhizobium sp. CCBAU 11434]
MQCESLGPAGDEDEWDTGLLSAGLSALKSILFLLWDTTKLICMAEFVELFKSSHEALKRQSTVADAAGQDSGSHPWLRPGRLLRRPAPSAIYISAL